MEQTKLIIERQANGAAIEIANLHFFVKLDYKNIAKLADTRKLDAKVDKLACESFKCLDADGEIKPEYSKEYTRIEKKAAKLIVEHTLGKGAFHKLYAKFPNIDHITSIMDKVNDQLANYLKVGV